MAFSLASVSKTQPKAPIMVIHGGPGIGKTTFAASAPSAVFIPTEDGFGSLNADAFPIATSFADVMSAMTVLYQEKHDFKTMVVDSLSALEMLISQAVAKDNNKTSIEEIPYGRGYGLALSYWQQFLDAVIALRNDKSILPILIAHSNVERYDAPDVDSYDRYVIALHKKAMALIYERADLIGFASLKTLVRKEEVGFDKKISRGVGTGERLLHLVEKPAFLAKNRYQLPESMPLAWDSFQAALNTAMQTTQPTKQQPKN